LRRTVNRKVPSSNRVRGAKFCHYVCLCLLVDTRASPNAQESLICARNRPSPDVRPTEPARPECRASAGWSVFSDSL
jgi:hypothetical protein